MPMLSRGTMYVDAGVCAVQAAKALAEQAGSSSANSSVSVRIPYFKTPDPEAIAPQKLSSISLRFPSLSFKNKPSKSCKPTTFDRGESFELPHGRKAFMTAKDALQVDPQTS